MLQLFSIFHLNLAYSSIEEAQRAEVVRRCYWPLLRLAERTGAPIGIEATGYTSGRPPRSIRPGSTRCGRWWQPGRASS